jgi:hypothetical protein
MAIRAFGLDNLLDDLRSRYGEADAVVVQLKAELDKRRQEELLHPLVERRAKNSPAKSHSRAGWQDKFKSSHDAPASFLH